MTLFYNIYKLNTSDNSEKYEKVIDELIIAIFAGIGVVIILANLMIFI